MSIFKSLKSAYNIQQGDTLNHPVFGKIRVDGIFVKENDDFSLYCTLLDFNNTMKSFDASDLKELKYKNNKKFRVVK